MAAAAVVNGERRKQINDRHFMTAKYEEKGVKREKIALDDTVGTIGNHREQVALLKSTSLLPLLTTHITHPPSGRGVKRRRIKIDR